MKRKDNQQLASEIIGHLDSICTYKYGLIVGKYNKFTIRLETDIKTPYFTVYGRFDIPIKTLGNSFSGKHNFIFTDDDCIIDFIFWLDYVLDYLNGDEKLYSERESPIIDKTIPILNF